MRDVAWLLVIGVACATCSGAREETGVVPAPVLEPDELSNVDRVLAAMSRVTPAHQSRGAVMRAEGDQTAAQGRYGPAAKAYGEAAMYNPTWEHLMLYARVSALLSTPRPSVDEERAAQAQLLARAKRLLDAAARLAPDEAATAAVARERACLDALRHGNPLSGCTFSAPRGGPR